jgi:ring-1,2-phenylacetyl-CoA epoxidase subunit PaaE
VGRAQGELLARVLDDVLAGVMQPPLFYVCGPEGLMSAAQQELDRRGIAKDRIKRELYSAPLPADAQSATVQPGVVDPKTNPEYTVTTQQVRIRLDGKDYTVTVKPKDHILDAALNHGIDPPYACQEGVCCTCRAKLLSGLVALDEREGLSDEELAQGYILTCQAHPLTADVSLEYC